MGQCESRESITVAPTKYSNTLDVERHEAISCAPIENPVVVPTIDEKPKTSYNEDDDEKVVIMNESDILAIVTSEEKLYEFKTLLELQKSSSTSQQLFYFTKFVMLVNKFYENKKYKISDELVSNLNNLLTFFSNPDSNPTETTIDELVAVSVEIEDQSDMQQSFLKIIEQIKADPESIDNIINCSTELFKKFAIIMFRKKESDLNIDEFKEALKIFILDNSSGKSACTHYNKCKFEDVESRDDKIDMRIFIQMFTCTECGILENNHSVCNKYNGNTYYCNDCGMIESLHRVCDTFKRDHSELFLSLYDEGSKHCTDCGKNRYDHESNLKNNGTLPCDIYHDDGFMHCTICSFSLNEHLYQPIIKKLNRNTKDKFDLTMLKIKLSAQEYLKNIFNGIIILTIINFVNSKNYNIIEHYYKKYHNKV